MQSPRPHDLLWLHPTVVPVSMDGDLALPDWVVPQWPVVVRRASCTDQIPVGLRGPLRSQRHAAQVRPDAIQKSVTPEALRQSQCWLTRPELVSYAPVATLIGLSRLLQNLELSWGPTGSVGFALATGCQVLRSDSDLDLLIRAPQPLSVQQMTLLQDVLQNRTVASCRIDLQIDTGKGGFAFNEWLRGSGKILLKTNTGPRLTDNPWA